MRPNFRAGHYGTERAGLHIGQRVRVTQRYLELYPTSQMRGGILLNFCRGTECRVQFTATKYPRQIDERFLEPSP